MLCGDFVGRARWIVIDTHDPWVASVGSPILTKHPGRVRALARRIARDPHWRSVYERDGVLVFRKVGEP